MKRKAALVMAAISLLGSGKSLRLLLALAVTIPLVACFGGPTVQMREYRLETELPQDLPEEVPCYRVQGPKGFEFEWARGVATALGFSGDPLSESKSAAQPMWTWTGPERSSVLDVYGSIAHIFTGEAQIANWGHKIRASAYVPAWQ